MLRLPGDRRERTIVNEEAEHNIRSGVVADHVEPAKTTALESLGKGEQAQSIAIGWLRPTVTSSGPSIEVK